MKPIEFGYHRIWVLLQIIVVVLKNSPQKFILSILDSFKHVFTIGSVIKEGAAFTLTSQRGHRVDFTHHQRSHQSVRPDAANVILVINFEQFSYMVEGIGSVISKGINR